MMKKNILLPNLVLDLDEVLLHDPSEGIIRDRNFFLERSFLPKDSYGNTYIAPAYLSEFLKFAISRFNVAFFSSGDEKRNRSVVQDMWINVFDTNKPEHLVILSREDVTRLRLSDDLNPKGVDRDIWASSYKKDITKIGKLDTTILVDDTCNWVLKDQVPNFLKAPSTGFYAFESLAKDYEAENTCSRIVEDYFLQKNSEKLDNLIAFYKLLYITGVLDKAAQHETGIVNGLYALQFDGEKPKFDDCMREIAYYIRGYTILSGFSQQKLHQYFPHVESHFRQA